ncbi:MAG: multifunctional CCA addition/repair protein [Cellvibrionales bacterium]|nr:multifunctional CCA addition/repair protein [Cellvibrionales bacterium]
MKTYLVGGAVRDKCLNLPVIDKDWVVVGSTPEQMLAKGFVQVGKDFPVFLHPKTKEEYALARQERKAGVGYTGFICDFAPTVTLEEDLLRRDLTINAMAESQDGDMIDPYQGQKDLERKQLRHVSPAFSEDPLRVLRVARFAARFANLGFTVAPETMALMQTMVQSNELKSISAERIWRETEKALTSNTPRVYFEVLRACGALKQLFPEIDALFGIPQTEKWHPEIDTGIHTLMVLDQIAKTSTNTSVRFAALVHDLGKGITPENILPSHRGHEKQGLPLVNRLSERLGVPKDAQQLALLVCEFHLHSHKAFELKPTTVFKLFKSLDVFRKPERLKHFLLVTTADATGRKGFEEAEYPQAAYLQQCFDAIKTITIKDLGDHELKGPAIGEAIDRLKVKKIAEIKKQLAI